MPKTKSHRGAAKRFKKTGTGKISRARQGRRHILTKKSPKRKRQLRRRAIVTGGDAKRLHVLLPD
jgi:large subunit ribosomal protein L35